MAQAALALSQLVEGRNIRMMGSQAGDRKPEYIRRTEIDRAIVGLCEGFVATYYMPTFAEYWYLRDEWLRRREFRIAEKLDRSINKFRGPYSLYRVIHEMAMTGFDMKFDQHHTITTALGVEDEDSDDADQSSSPSYLAADIRRVEAQTRAGYAAMDRARAMGLRTTHKEELPSFEDALKFARENMAALLDLQPIVPTPDEKKPSEEVDEADDVEEDESTDREAASPKRDLSDRVLLPIDDEEEEEDNE